MPSDSVAILPALFPALNAGQQQSGMIHSIGVTCRITPVCLDNSKHMSTYILVHGAWHGAWCWKRVASILTEAGHCVIAPDLPGHGKKPVSSRVTLRTYVDYLCDLIGKQETPIILVGHSMAGIIISQAAEYLHERIQTLVYVTGFLPRDGESMKDIEREIPASLVAPNLIYSDDGLFVTLPDDIIREVFYGDCAEVDVNCAVSLLQPQPVLPFVAPARLSEPHFGRVKKIYIECLLDRAIPVVGQRLMYSRTSCERIHTLNAAHSPFLSVPGELADVLQKL